MRIPLPRRRIWRWLIYWFSLSLVLTAVDMLWAHIRRHITPGYDTTRLISPVLPDGRIDYWKISDDERGAAVTPQNNAAVLLLQAFGRGALPPTEIDGITDKLGMPRLAERGEYLILYEDFCKQHSLPDDPPEAPHQWPWTLSPIAADWVKANQRPLELVVEASHRQRFFIPFDDGNRPEIMASVLLPHVQYVRQVSVLLLSRAMMRLNDGDAAGFRQDVLATYRLALLMGQSTLVEYMMGVNDLFTPACLTARAAAASGKLAAADLRALAAGLAALGELPPLDPFIDRGERYLVLDFMQAMATAPASHSGKMFNEWLNPPNGIVPTFLFQFLPLAYEQNMSELNRAYDGALVALHQPNYAARISALHLWRTQVDNQCKTITLYISPYFAEKCLMLDAVSPLQRLASAQMQDRLTQVALALAAYKADHGTYPQALPQLSPDYLANVPDDLFVDRPLVYAPGAKGYTLYSLRSEMHDHGRNMSNISASVP